MAAVVLVAALSSGISQMGLANSLVYNYGKNGSRQTGLIFVVSAGLVAILAFPLSLIGQVYLYPAGYEQSTRLIIFLAMSSAAFAFASTASQICSDLKIYNATRIILPLSLACFLLAFFLAGVGLDYTEVLLFQVSVMATLAAVMILHLWRHTQSNQAPTEQLFTSIVAIGGYALKYHGTILMSLLLLNVDKIFLLGRVSPEQFGFYALAFATTRILGSIQDAAAVTVFSRFAGKIGLGLEAAVASSFRLSFIPMLIVASVIAAASPLAIPLIFGKAFSSMTVPFILLSFEAVLGSASWTLAQRFNAGGRPGMILMRQGLVMLPVLAVLPFVPEHEAGIYLAALMLCAALLRLLITLAMFPLVLKEPLPRIFPRWQEIRDHAERLRQKSIKSY